MEEVFGRHLCNGTFALAHTYIRILPFGVRGSLAPRLRATYRRATTRAITPALLGLSLFIDQPTFRFQLFNFQAHASPNRVSLALVVLIAASPQQLFVFVDAFLRRLFRELRVLVEIRRPLAL